MYPYISGIAVRLLPAHREYDLDVPLHEDGCTNLPTRLKHGYNVFPKRPLIRGGGWIFVEVPRFEEVRDQEALKVLYLVRGYF